MSSLLIFRKYFLNQQARICPQHVCCCEIRMKLSDKSVLPVNLSLGLPVLVLHEAVKFQIYIRSFIKELLVIDFQILHNNYIIFNYYVNMFHFIYEI